MNLYSADCRSRLCRTPVVFFSDSLGWVLVRPLTSRRSLVRQLIIEPGGGAGGETATSTSSMEEL
jgi:hypothetical protein